MAITPPPSSVKGLRVFFMQMADDRLEMLDHQSELHEEDSESGPSSFCEPVAEFSYARSRALVVLVVRSGKVIRAAVGYRGISGGTGLSQVRLSNEVTVQNLDLAPHLASLPTKIRKRASDLANSTGLLSEKASESLLDALHRLDPQIARVVALASRSKHNPVEDLPERDQLRIQQERDAAMTAMFIAGIDRQSFLKSEIDAFDGNKWFMDQVKNARLREDTMLFDDASKFPGFEKVDEHVSGVVRMYQANVLLSIFLINRQPLEQLTGSDLIYYNETFKSFVLVQYKAMEREGDADIFRLPNKGLSDEIARMRQIEIEMGSPASTPGMPRDFRLDPRAFFLKFCPRIVQQPTEPDLVPGMYFTLDHWSLLSESESLKGTGGGQCLRYEKKAPYTNADRYFSNSDFAIFVRSGWVGTAANQSAVLEKIITETLNSGRSVTLATACTILP